MQKINVIIIDDDHTYRYVFKSTVDFPGYNFTIFEAEHGDEGLNIVSKLNVDGILSTILFVDLNMPGIDGWNFIEELQEKYAKELKEKFLVYILTNSIHPRNKEKAKEFPFILEYINKPLTVEKIKEILTILPA